MANGRRGRRHAGGRTGCALISTALLGVTSCWAPGVGATRADIEANFAELSRVALEVREASGGSIADDLGDFAIASAAAAHTDVTQVPSKSPTTRPTAATTTWKVPTGEGYDCCANQGLKRVQCPPNIPVLCCDESACSAGKDYCCVNTASSCSNKGGARLCQAKLPTTEEEEEDDEDSAEGHAKQEGPVPPPPVSANTPAKRRAYYAALLHSLGMGDVLGEDRAALIPSLVPTNGMTLKLTCSWVERRGYADLGYTWYLSEISERGQEMRPVGYKVAAVEGTWESVTFGHQGLSVQDSNGVDVFRIARSHVFMKWRAQSYRVLPARQKQNRDALFSIRRDVMNPVEIVWRVYRGLKQKNDLVFFCVGKIKEATCYNNLNKGKVSGTVRQTEGSPRKHEKSRFEVVVFEGEDGALLMAVAQCMDNYGKNKLELNTAANDANFLHQANPRPSSLV